MPYEPGQFNELVSALTRLKNIGAGTPGSIATHATVCLSVKELEALTNEINNLNKKHQQRTRKKGIIDDIST